MNQKNNKIEYFKGEFLHPSLDIKNDILCLGFRFISKDLKEEEIFIIATKEGIQLIKNDHFDLEEKRYFIEIRGRLLSRIEEKWNLKELNNFIEDYNSGKLTGLSLKEVFEKIKVLFKKYMELEREEDYDLITAWVIGSYFFPIFSTFPFLNIKAPKGSGKTQCLNFLNQVCFNAAKAKPSLAALCDTVDSLRGTYLIDQADLLRRRGNEELLEILTDSYKKGGKRRMRFPEKRGGWRTIEQETYSPKAFASIGQLPEDLADRCLIIPLLKSGRNFPEPNEENEDWKQIRGELYQTLLTNFSVIKDTYDILKIHYRMNSKIIGRDLELWLPLETILKFCIPEEGVDGVRKRFSQLYGYTDYEPSELEKTVIKTINGFFDEREKNEILLSPSEIREIIEEEVWEDKLLRACQKDIKIGYIIKKFNLSTEKKRTNKGVAYLFQKEKVKKIKNLYCKEPENITHSTLLPENSAILIEKGRKR